MIIVEQLRKSYGDVVAVDGISFEVREGEIFGMVGPNGAGKSTTIESLQGLRVPDSGKISVLGLDPTRQPYELHQHIGVQLQSAALPERLKVWETLDLFASFYRYSVDWRELLPVMGLEDKRDAFVNELSGGQRQRVFIALALVNDPDVVFLDELTTSLDPQARRAMWDLVRGVRARGKTVVLTTHFMEEAERLCDRVAIIDEGLLVALDSVGNLINSLGEEYRITLKADGRPDLTAVADVPGVVRVEQIGDRVVISARGSGVVGPVTSALEEHKLPLRDLQVEEPTLEDVFLSLTGKEMRE